MLISWMADAEMETCVLVVGWARWEGSAVESAEEEGLDAISRVWGSGRCRRLGSDALIP